MEFNSIYYLQFIFFILPIEITIKGKCPIII